MNKEGILMLAAGVVFGAVAGFIVTREVYEKKMAAAPHEAHGHAGTTQGQQAGTGMPPGGEARSFDPAEHASMTQQFIQDAKQPGNLQAKVTLANIYYDRGNFAEAAVWYEDALKLDDKNPDVLVDLGVCYKSTNRPADALASFDRALAIQKDKKEALFNKVVVYAFDLKDKAKAQEALKRLKEAMPGDPKVAELEAEVKKVS